MNIIDCKNITREREINPTELRQKINRVAYSFLWKINNIKKQQKALQQKLETTEEKLDNFLEWFSDRMDIGWKQGWDMSQISKEHLKVLRKQRDICYIGLLDYWG